MKKCTLALLCLLIPLLASCVFAARLGLKEKSWIRHTMSPELVYIDGDVKAYRSDGAFYYFNGGVLVLVNQTLVSADKVPTKESVVPAKK